MKHVTSQASLWPVTGMGNLCGAVEHAAHAAVDHVSYTGGGRSDAAYAHHLEMLVKMQILAQ